ncbi:MAG TPA: dihydroneopterin aldolase [Rhodospirillaceae bacterium]|jgi:dihydroneopterin aldolase|nr:dihydroneopterin aldolase [Alphaproteobacteria bacterium]HBH26518.1 dihydroneopterin aldolase [Rhodospirillaceae bacterium]
MQTFVVLEGLEILAPVGVHPAERAGPQRLLLDVTLEVEPPADDAIAQAVDYETLAQDIRSLAAQRHRDLLETLAAEVAALARANPGVRGGRVALRKPGLLGAQAVGVAVVF